MGKKLSKCFCLPSEQGPTLKGKNHLRGKSHGPNMEHLWSWMLNWKNYRMKGRWTDTPGSSPSTGRTVTFLWWRESWSWLSVQEHSDETTSPCRRRWLVWLWCRKITRIYRKPGNFQKRYYVCVLCSRLRCKHGTQNEKLVFIVCADEDPD